ncbi:MAG: hypothetical protein A2W28_13405 [Gammaproteobacteria bacterium RBG_16_51_14]|nr:MAG: hypothetical protein A2W28_13405 [Gammaproteobacteria bacterium RBG_16_51_14]
MASLSKTRLIYVLFIMVALVYFSGIWDKAIKPVISQKHTEKFTYVSAQPMDAESVEFFVIINDFDSFYEDEEEMAKYAMNLLYQHFQTNPELKEMNLMVYFILHAEGSAHMRRKRALAVLRYEGADGGTISINRLAK